MDLSMSDFSDLRNIWLIPIGATFLCDIWKLFIDLKFLESFIWRVEKQVAAFTNDAQTFKQRFYCT